MPLVHAFHTPMTNRPYIRRTMHGNDTNLVQNFLPKHYRSTNKPYVAGSELKLHSVLISSSTVKWTWQPLPSACRPPWTRRLPPFIPHPPHNELEDNVWGRGLQSSQASEMIWKQAGRTGRYAWVVTTCLCLVLRYGGWVWDLLCPTMALAIGHQLLPFERILSTRRRFHWLPPPT